MDVWADFYKGSPSIKPDQFSKTIPNNLPLKLTLKIDLLFYSCITVLIRTQICKKLLIWYFSCSDQNAQSEKSQIEISS